MNECFNILGGLASVILAAYKGPLGHDVPSVMPYQGIYLSYRLSCTSYSTSHVLIVIMADPHRSMVASTGCHRDDPVDVDHLGTAHW